ncbi:UDP-N-acetylmuramate dehydrogenase [Frisingicoccus sp.]|uniref:UDP-N-acetylmuramate dehydrogenase n=1 Tax=Frisingicoccus sp. TaxID=1918627 RepID=UPI002E794B18|nr:UDP-N-acetylmuramate dehydrogenase [Frisingicoccus sp.]MEE0752894.1 UDP-N-acetylmuramate dehydrogenase [Frisingicoccus sp.]
MTLAENLSEIIGGGQILENEPMKNHTTFRIGGPADVLVCPETEDGFIRGLGWCRRQKIPVYIIGNGSNLLVGDKGFRGVVFKICRNLDKTDIIEEDSVVRVHAGAGVMLAKLAKDVSAEGCGGFEFATGIPGTLGGAVTMNAGAYGGEMKDILKSVRAVDMEGNIREFSLEELELGYRTSRIQKEDWIVLSAEMVFEKGDAGAIMARVDELSRQRREKQPLEYPSAGSTFKRPEGYFAGKLIQDAGLKGYRVGDAMVSEKHSGFVINAGAATAEDVRRLMADVDGRVYEKFGVHLEPEVRLIGEFE